MRNGWSRIPNTQPKTPQVSSWVTYDAEVRFLFLYSIPLTSVVIGLHRQPIKTTHTRLFSYSEQIFAHFVSHQLPLLIRHARYFRLLHCLRAEFDEFEAYCAQGAKSCQASYPGEHACYPTR
jgi:hypothetical protein